MGDPFEYNIVQTLKAFQKTNSYGNVNRFCKFNGL